MKNPFELSDVSLDALKEMGNIGSGNAASALSLMLDEPVKIRVPEIKVLDAAAVVEAMGGPEQVMVGLLLCVSGDISGIILFLLQESFAQASVNTLTGGFLDLEGRTEIEESAMKEIGNIMASSYVNAMSALTGLNITVSVPSVSIDMLGSLMSVPAVYYANLSDQIIMIENSFSGILQDTASYVLLIPEEESLRKILAGLEV